VALHLVTRLTQAIRNARSRGIGIQLRSHSVVCLNGSGTRSASDSERLAFRPLACVGGAIYSLLVKDKHFNYLWRVPPASPEPQRLQPPIAEVVREVQRLAHAVASRHPSRTLSEQLWLAGTLMQFSDFNPIPAAVLATPWHKVAIFHAEIVREAATAPLTFAEQFAIASRHAGGGRDDALWLLFVAARLFARWSDTSLVLGLPSLSDGEKVALMQAWERALDACKGGDHFRQQDVAGDTYYVWTHALAHVRFSRTQAPPIDRGLARVFAQGTTLMQLMINHPLSPASTESDHKQAARYGNAIGRALSSS
jgi:hypothetical protein